MCACVGVWVSCVHKENFPRQVCVRYVRKVCVVYALKIGWKTYTFFQAPTICTNTSLTHTHTLLLQEFMKLMGLSNWLHWSAWFFKYLVFMLIAVVIMTILFGVKVSAGAVLSTRAEKRAKMCVPLTRAAVIQSICAALFSSNTCSSGPFPLINTNLFEFTFHFCHVDVQVRSATTFTFHVSHVFSRRRTSYFGSAVHVSRVSHSLTYLTFSHVDAQVGSTAVFTFSDASLIFVLLLLYAVATIVFCFAVSTFFEKGACVGGEYACV